MQFNACTTLSASWFTSAVHLIGLQFHVSHLSCHPSYLRELSICSYQINSIIDLPFLKIYFLSNSVHQDKDWKIYLSCNASDMNFRTNQFKCWPVYWLPLPFSWVSSVPSGKFWHSTSYYVMTTSLSAAHSVGVYTQGILCMWLPVTSFKLSLH